MRPARSDRAGESPPPRLRVPVTGGTTHRQLTVPHHPSSARLVRHQLVSDLTGHHTGRLGSDFVDDAAAVATELVGNAVRHAAALPGDVITVDWQHYPDGLEIRVTDGGSAQVPVMRVVTPDDVGGRGLAIVATLATRWGVAPADRGRCVWAWLGEASQVAS